MLRYEREEVVKVRLFSGTVLLDKCQRAWVGAAAELEGRKCAVVDVDGARLSGNVGAQLSVEPVPFSA